MWCWLQNLWEPSSHVWCLNWLLEMTGVWLGLTLWLSLSLIYFVLPHRLFYSKASVSPRGLSLQGFFICPLVSPVIENRSYTKFEGLGSEIPNYHFCCIQLVTVNHKSSAGPRYLEIDLPSWSETWNRHTGMRWVIIGSSCRQTHHSAPSGD